ncbi:hypothetical protein [Streptomyces sp. NBC_01565]|uniref:hypothetical protein n=1 Tax=unclassified Streptomyces TaxID=2593676 RepID=UPI00225566DB|nr:hypothetical protein [Streptomyces sp. NBC_01565]MCX4546990.1 hypothetical protein [Streptomyces sp. NBC_01565]
MSCAGGFSGHAAAIPGSALTAGVHTTDETAIGRGIRDARRREATGEGESGACMSPSANR